jgi:hypothetical protein
LIAHIERRRRLKVFKNRVLRRLCRPEWDQVTGERRKLHNEEFKGLYSSPNVIRLIKSRRMRGTGHVANMGERRGAHGVLVGKPEGKNHLEDLDLDGEIILKWIFSKWIVRAWTDLVHDRGSWPTLVKAAVNLGVP